MGSSRSKHDMSMPRCMDLTWSFLKRGQSLSVPRKIMCHAMHVYLNCKIGADLQNRLRATQHVYAYSEWCTGCHRQRGIKYKACSWLGHAFLHKQWFCFFEIRSFIRTMTVPSKSSCTALIGHANSYFHWRHPCVPAISHHT